MKSYKNRLSGILLIVFAVLHIELQAQVPPGESFPMWQEGCLDIHHINTGKGDATFLILPDGTTMIIDAGEHFRPPGPRETPPRPDGSRSPGEWIARYIRHMLQASDDIKIDYVMVTHFDTDHMGGYHDELPQSNLGPYRLSGITDVGNRILFGKVVDRGWPGYDWPRPLTHEHVANYRSFLEWQIANKGMKVERFIPGSNEQFKLVHQPERYPGFEIRNIVANGEVWTGVGNNTRHHFPDISTLTDGLLPTENMSSAAIRLSYGAFDYFTGGDLIGVPPAGSPEWMDIETPVALSVGPVDVHVLNHHGFIDAGNAFFIQTLQPRVHIIQSWVAAHPAHSTLSRIMSTRLYPGPRDVFMTNIKEETRIVIGSSIDRLKSQQGHIVIRVVEGGNRYWIYILDDASESFQVKNVFGPYESR